MSPAMACRFFTSSTTRCINFHIFKIKLIIQSWESWSFSSASYIASHPRKKLYIKLNSIKPYFHIICWVVFTHTHTHTHTHTQSSDFVNFRTILNFNMYNRNYRPSFLSKTIAFYLFIYFSFDSGQYLASLFYSQTILTKSILLAFEFSAFSMTVAWLLNAAWEIVQLGSFIPK